jgi:hypothetical protein
VRVRGRAYPVLVMDWVEGYTLDQYVRSNAATPDTFRALSSRWAEIVAELERAEIGHGDLQHGNILVAAGDLKLVDYDGMYVPALRGRLSTETGHRAYQHPARTEKVFGPDIDRFAALVLYVSLAALAEKPALASRCSGDRLLFEASDYRDPKRSTAFGELRSIRGALRPIVDALEGACLSPIERVPRLLDLVQVSKSSLPTWMRTGSAIPTPTQVHVDPPRRGAVVSPPRPPTPPQPSWRPSPAAASTPTYPAPAVPTTPSNLPRRFNARGFAAGSVGWLMIGTVVMSALKFSPEAYVFTLFLGFLYIAGVNRISPAKQPPTSTTPTPPRWSPPSRPLPRTILSSQGGTPVIGSAIRNKYHRPSCEWARKMSTRNRIQFASAADALTRGYRPCRVCRP